MRRASIKAILIGGVLDMIATIVLTLPLGFYAIHQLKIANMPPDQIRAALAKAMDENVIIHWTKLGIGLGCSVLAGFVAARIARHDELLNGALSAFLSFFLTVITRPWIHYSDTLLREIFEFAVSAAMGLLGGYFWLRRARALRSTSSVANVSATHGG